MKYALDNHIGTVNIGSKIITNLRFADDIDGLAGSESELSNLIKKIDSTSRKYGMQINATKTKIMTNSEGNFTSEIKINNDTLKIVEKCKYLGAIIDDKGSKYEIMADNNRIIKTKCYMVRQITSTETKNSTYAIASKLNIPLCVRNVDANKEVTRTY